MGEVQGWEKLNQKPQTVLGGGFPAFLKHQQTFWGSAFAPHNGGRVCKHLAVVLAHWGFTQPSTPASSLLINNNYFFSRNTQHTKTFRGEDWDEQTNASFVILQLGVWGHHHIWRMWEWIYERTSCSHTHNRMTIAVQVYQRLSGRWTDWRTKEGVIVRILKIVYYLCIYMLINCACGFPETQMMMASLKRSSSFPPESQW